MIGSPLGGIISDKYGRRFSFLVAICLTIIIQMSSYFIFNLYTFAIARLLAGFSFSFTLSIPLTIAAEITTTKLRGRI